MWHNDLRYRLARKNAPDPGHRHPVPGTPRWNAQFGHGWTCIICSGMAGMLAGGVWGVKSGSGVGLIRGLAVSIGSVAAMALISFAYLVWYRLGFGLSPMRSRPGCSDDVVWPDERPVLYWAFMGVSIVVATVALIVAVWAIVHPSAVGELFDQRRAVR